MENFLKILRNSPDIAAMAWLALFGLFIAINAPNPLCEMLDVGRKIRRGATWDELDREGV